MKHLLCISLIVLLSGCYTSKNNNPEIMADLASQLKDIATAVDGTLKFSETPYSSTDELLKAAVNNDLSKLAPFKAYTLIVDAQKNNAVLLLCDKNSALIEDVGCTAQSDIQHWQAKKAQKCEITVNAQQFCN
ncbi:hypothetical protein CWC11_04245 [Pseudoalteromonas sp. S3178]|uniref:hypothetical protein n=1 Tax=Pseudoalteromonas sp. S3178 TaxID=579532 RepID=UPI00110A5059|nr:hypothetical protein [Pseudoalteromonas sp. S3178]TMP08943.1 hypothetical protein CWC11_04245 [Pseudoalteromonas sp. S3178]